MFHVPNVYDYVKSIKGFCLNSIRDFIIYDVTSQSISHIPESYSESMIGMILEITVAKKKQVVTQDVRIKKLINYTEVTLFCVQRVPYFSQRFAFYHKVFSDAYKVLRRHMVCLFS